MAFWITSFIDKAVPIIVVIFINQDILISI